MGASLMPADLFPLSDALQMNLRIADQNKATDSITGKNSTAMKMPSIGLAMTIKPQIVSSRVWMGKLGLEHCYLLLKVQGDLYMLATSDKDGMLTMSLINAMMIADHLEGFFGNNFRSKPNTLAEKLSKGIVATYVRHVEDKKWLKADLSVLGD